MSSDGGERMDPKEFYLICKNTKDRFQIPEGETTIGRGPFLKVSQFIYICGFLLKNIFMELSSALEFQELVHSFKIQCNEAEQIASEHSQ